MFTDILFEKHGEDSLNFSKKGFVRTKVNIQHYCNAFRETNVNASQNLPKLSDTFLVNSTGLTLNECG